MSTATNETEDKDRPNTKPHCDSDRSGYIHGNGSCLPTTIIARSSWRAARELVPGFKQTELNYQRDPDLIELRIPVYDHAYRVLRPFRQ